MPRKIQKIADPYAINVPCNHSKCDSSNQPFETCILNNQINLSYKPVFVISKKSLLSIYEFNFPINVGDITHQVIEIHFGKKFNQPLNKNVLPKGLQRIRFGRGYKHNLIPGVNYNPNTLLSIKFGDNLFDFENGGEAPPLQI
ncbi:hypothetical protein ACTFIY_011060 [Dictyostelium cf. discoideum]